ncbi:pentapeptide repeat-containing protein [Thalassospira sp. SN3W]|uniref:pentapeptide repeat-containing protein n=1 Tax=Thalassospira sp. SN3W TaxID=3035476 RepID=UPI00311B39A7
MTEEVTPTIRILEGKAALDLWRQGREAWNSWVDQHPGWDISFRGVDFSTEWTSDGVLSFAGYHFGRGNIDFSETTFGNGDVDFSNAIFGDGSIDFSKITFGDGDLNFSNATFGNGNLYFHLATFGKGDVFFTRVTFGKGEVFFSGTNLGDGDVDFTESTFDKIHLNFAKTRIKDLYFKPKAIGSCYFEAEGLSITGRAIFDLPQSASALKSFKLLSASFDGPLTLKGNLNIIPDFRATRYSHQVELSDLKVKLPRISPKLGWPLKLSQVAQDPQDGPKLRRLKEIAETNKDHQAALRFSADENRAKRWIETSWFGSVLDMAFSAFSNYGQSILRPSFWLGVIFALSMYAYKAKQIPKLATDGWADWVQAALLSASNSLPFLPQSRELRTGALKALYDTDSSSYVDALMITQGVLSFVFLFLIGLGLRNRFRL